MPRVLFGRGAISQVGEEAAALGDRILLICTPSLKASQAAGRVRDALDRLAAEFTGVAPHVPKEAVEAARRIAAAKQVNVVVALGGGSAIGVAKAVASIQPHASETPSPLGGEGRGAGLPLIAIPTTYAGSEMTPVFGIREEGTKRVQRNPAALPVLAIYDPELTLDLSPELTASTAMNALAHCVEACYARDVNPIVPPAALEGIRRIVNSLPTCVARADDIDSREELQLGAYLAAFSIANATMALHHGLCHVLGGRTGVAHGVLNAIMLPHVMRFNAEAVPDAMSAIADAMGAGARTRDAEAASRFTAALLESLPVPKRLRDAGVGAEMLEPAAVEAATNSSVRANPRPISEKELQELLRSAW